MKIMYVCLDYNQNSKLIYARSMQMLIYEYFYSLQ